MDSRIHCPLQGRHQVPGQGRFLQGLPVGRPPEIEAGKPKNLPGGRCTASGPPRQDHPRSTFPVYQDHNGIITITQESVNDTTVLQASSAPLKEIGQVLSHLLHYMRDTPMGFHILFCKLDISDGFWNLIVQAEDSFNFAYVLPQREGEPVRIVVPLAVQMGWVKSPPLFCAVSESAQDITQHLVDTNVKLPPHLLEVKMNIQHVPL